MAAGNPNKTHYPALDGLRGLAILLVVLYHNYSFIPQLNYGWLGVDLFFVLSGLLITDILLNTVDQKNYFKNFYARRVLRIFPLYYLSLLLFLIIVPMIPGSTLTQKYSSSESVWFWFYLQNWMLIFNPNPHSNMLGHFWSLAVEEQFYIIWPFLILLIKKLRLLLLLLLFLLLVMIAARTYIWIHHDHFTNYYSLFLFTRIDGLLLGSALAILQKINSTLLSKKTYLFVLILACLNFVFYFLNTNTAFSFPYWSVVGYTTFAALFALVVYEGVKGENHFIRFIFTNKILRFLGKYSYGFYIFHWPIYLLTISFFTTLSKQLPIHNDLLQLILSSTLATASGLLISLISYHFFEKYFLNMKKRFI